METVDEIYLFLVVLGGRAKKANIELHDVRWVVGSRIEDTYDVLRRDWFGAFEGLHIDSYKKINYVDGYKINLKNIQDKEIKNKKFLNGNSKKNLWFVNIGGYDPSSMQEKHEFGLVVASSKLEAKNIAKSNVAISKVPDLDKINAEITETLESKQFQEDLDGAINKFGASMGSLQGVSRDKLEAEFGAKNLPVGNLKQKI